ncbi:MAG: monovalent cation/H+ antiporter complex subunit F [Anaerolineae bacterium]|nr:monovalent cation/H+ antiporter complex subunit F [Thermoflexales bacterium]MDW8406631.1 monovalent cation/H+ antiporter complex subunit F [Anaerolineae bacterium]
MENILNNAIALALIGHVLLILIPLWRVVRGQSPVDRLLGVELASVLILCVLVLIAMFTGQDIYMDVALIVAALSFIGTLALAKYLADQRMF